ncbi:MAG: ATP-binding protein [Bacteroidia bacterium]
MGECEDILHRPARAMEYMLEALDIAIEEEMDKSVGVYSVSIGFLKLENKEEAEGMDYLNKGIAILDSNQMRSQLAAVYSNLGNYYKNSGQPNKAIESFEAGLRLAEAVGDKVSQAGINYNLGIFSGNLGEAYWDKALQYYKNCLEISRENNIGYGLIMSNYGMGSLYRQMGKPDAAIAHLQYVLDHTEGRQHLENRANAMHEMALAYEEARNFEQGFKYLNEYLKMQDTLFEQKQTKDVAEIEEKYQAQKKDAEIARQTSLIAKERAEKLRIRLWGGLGVGMLVIAGLVLFFILRNKRREAEYALHDQEREAENLRQLDQLKSRFFANISHEFRTPLTLILGPLQKLKKGETPGNPDTIFRLMERNAQRLLQLINQLLDLSKLESGSLKLLPEKEDIHAFLRAITGNFESMAEVKNIRYIVEAPAGSRMAEFDKDKLEKILSNLLSNAFKFTPEEGKVLFHGTIDDEGMLQVRIEDSGIGIPKAEQEHIFERFYRVENSSFSGTGIGLALVKELVDLFEGTIRLESEENKGTRIQLAIPLNTLTAATGERPAEAPEKRAKAPAVIEAPQANPPASTAEKEARLLIVEDNEDVRLYIRSCLENRFQILEAANGREGLDMALEHIPDLIISDVMMPEMDGVSLSQELKHDLRSSHIPLILLTAKADRDSRIEGLQTGADDYLAKPFDEEELNVRVSNLIAQRRRLREQFGKDIVNLSPEKVLVKSLDKQFLERMISIAEQYMSDEHFSVEDMAREAGMSRHHLHRKLKALTDQSPSVFLRTLRLKRAKQLLEADSGTAS